MNVLYICVTFFNFHQMAALIKIKCSVPPHSVGDVHQAGGHLEVLSKNRALAGDPLKMAMQSFTLNTCHMR